MVKLCASTCDSFKRRWKRTDTSHTRPSPFRKQNWFRVIYSI